MGKKCLLLLVILTLVLSLGNFVSAKRTENSDNKMIELTKKAANVQLSLSDGGYTDKEVKEALSPYFSKQFIDQFITMNMAKESDGLYYVTGTDFSIYYIPFFRYEGETWVIADNSIATVYELFPVLTDGPVGYDNHYEAVVFTIENGSWKVKEIVPQFDPNQFDSIEKEILIFRTIKSFFSSLFGSIFMNN